MTTIRFHQGLRTIGGTVVEVTTDQARCLFDFGLDGAAELDERLRPRPGREVRDRLATGRLPPVPALYDRRDLGDLALPAFCEAGPEPFVLISHMHIDHMGALGMLAEDVEVLMTKESLTLYRALCESDDVLRRPHGRVTPLNPMAWTQRGDIRLRAVPVDHDVPGACGFEFDAPGGRIAYTGDLRIHGFRGSETPTFAEAVRGADLLITEGVTASFGDDFDAVTASTDTAPMRTERGEVDDILSALSRLRGLAFINLYDRNVERVAALNEALPRLSRTLVLEPRAAHILQAFAPSGRYAVYQPLDAPYVANRVVRVTREQLRENPGAYALQLSYENLLEILDFDAETSLYIHADGMPLGDYDPSFSKLQSFLAGMRIRYLPIRCGGHATPGHLKHLLKVISPRAVVPLHSLAPEKVHIPGTRQLLPRDGERFRLANRQLTPLD